MTRIGRRHAKHVVRVASAIGIDLLEFGAVKIDATGDRYDFSPNLDFDHYRRRRNLLLGHRQVCRRPPTCKSAEAARDTDLPRRHFAASAADDGNLLGRALSAPTTGQQTLEGHHVGISHRPLPGDDHLPALSGVATAPPRQKKPGENEKAFCLAAPVGRSEGSVDRRLNPPPTVHGSSGRNPVLKLTPQINCGIEPRHDLRGQRLAGDLSVQH